MALGLNHPLTEMSARNISRGVKAAGVKADKLTTFLCRLSRKSVIFKHLEPSGHIQGFNGID